MSFSGSKIKVYQNDSMHHSCIVNVGHFRSGTTTLAEAANSLGLKANRDFPDLSQQQYKDFLLNPKKAVLDWFAKDGGKEKIIALAGQHDLICDGWIALLPFLPPTELSRLKDDSHESGILLNFIATTRDADSTVRSELQHWVVHDLEEKAGLIVQERDILEHYLRKRAVEHQQRIQRLRDDLSFLKELPLANNVHDTWPESLSSVSNFAKEEWSRVLLETGKQNANPPLPMEGILFTLRLGSDYEEAKQKMLSVETLLDQIERDSLCRYLVVLALDSDEEDSISSIELIQRLENRVVSNPIQFKSFHVIINPPRSLDKPFRICSVWNEMAIEGWKQGADWVVLLGDDITVECSFHYRAFYRSFLDIANRLNVPFGFGCPFWNDRTFPGFPSFPCIGKAHLKIFGGLIPEHRLSVFINQDLDPYVHRFYQKYFAAPCVSEAVLSNGSGGNIGSEAPRYERCPAGRWQDFVEDDIGPIRRYVPEGTKEAILVDVVVPSYRVRLDYLQSICYLKVPDYMQTLFIIIIDNREALLESAAVIADATEGHHSLPTVYESERILEEYLSKTANTIRVRCNETNVGASASRNRGIDESAAEYILNLDDDLVPNPDLLEQYGHKLQEIDSDIVGLIGLVRFPRSQSPPLKHAAVLMSYLTFMFEIAEADLYPNPAWGVTANILFRRSKIRFDLAYAKTGGGEDVDFALRMAEACHGGKLLPVPEACVVHPFWPGSAVTLAMHFFNWAIGDSCLFTRFPKYRYLSFPNVAETLFLLLLLGLPSSMLGPWDFVKLIPAFIIADFVVDYSNRAEYKHRCLQLQDKKSLEDETNRNFLFLLVAHFLANVYVAVLECGRLYGHLSRKDLFNGLCHRFDWHCGRLKNAPRNFRKREAYKFSLFVSILLFFKFGPTSLYWMDAAFVFEKEISIDFSDLL